MISLDIQSETKSHYPVEKVLATYPKQMDTRRVQVIPRCEIAGIKEMNVEGEKTYLGEVRNFKNNSFLNENLPKDLSISWTRMPAQRELPAHYHPCASLILVTKGEGQSTGDTVADISTGDIVHIPEWNLHGFKGKGHDGFSALSIQFQETAIFSSEDRPETTYIDRESIPLAERELKIISRNSLLELNEISQNGQKKNLGIVKNFASHSLMKEKLPSYFSAAWVHLNPGERLETHVHDTDSMIILTEGFGSLQGDLNQPLQEGDTVYVPAGYSHGFTGAGDKGFWALSIQFQSTSLYEDSLNPQVQFIEDEKISFENFLKLNEHYVQKFLENPIFKINPQDLRDRPEKKKKLMDCLQVMSDSFQRLIFSRISLCDDKAYRPIYLEHFLDELGHDTDLQKERGDDQLLWDPILHASCSWFYSKNFLIDHPARIVMVQMVLERGAFFFYSHYNQILKDGLESDHISEHSVADEGHDKLGVELLKEESPRKLYTYTKLLEQSWDMLGQFLKRTEELLSKE